MMWNIISYLVSLTLINGGLLETVELFCPDGWLNCGNGACVSPLFICNGEDECGNMKDEENCEVAWPPVECPEGRFLCEDGIHCIPKKLVCDGNSDCSDSSDEVHCDNSSTCEGFLKCVPTRLHCDGIEDCEDGSDELNCTAVKYKCEISEGHYECSNGICLNQTRLCDGKKDCPNNEDEEIVHCNSVCNITCSHGCIKTPNSQTCYCPQGFQLHTDNKTCIDIDECQIEGFCSQICENDEGSVHCYCFDGFEASNNTCRAHGKEPLMIISDANSIRGLWIRSHEYFPIHDYHETKTFGTDYDMIDQKVYWTYHSATNVVIYSSSLKNSDSHLVISFGLVDPSDLAIDWLGRNIYIVDAGLNSIIACKLDGVVCTFVVQNNSPKRIVLDSHTGLMYWINCVKPIIYKQGMDGTELCVLVEENVSLPNDLAIDVISKQLYWSDSTSKSIEKINLDGSGRKVIIQDPVFNPHYLTVFEDNLYWTDLSKYTIDTCNKFTGKNYSTILKNRHLVGSIHIYHPVLYKKDISNLCESNQCSHICLLSPRKTHTCACPIGFHLDVDNTTCLYDLTSPRLFIIENEKLYHLHPESVGNNAEYTTLKHVHLIGDISYNWLIGILYASEIREHLICTINITTYSSRPMFTKDIHKVESIEFDWIGNNIYWLDSEKQTIEVASTNAKHRLVLARGLSKCVDLVLYPEKGLMFVAVLGMTSHIAMYNMDGKNYKKLEETEDMVVSLSIDYEFDRLYWAHSSIISARDIDKIERGPTVTILRDIGNITSIAVGNKYLYWIDLTKGALNYADKLNSSLKKTISVLPHYSSVDNVTLKLDYIQPMFNLSSTCKNSGCDHLCLPLPHHYVCACAETFVLATDGQSCTDSKHNHLCSSTEFKCSNGGCIQKEKICDGFADCPDKSDEKDCDAKPELISCDRNQFRCNENKCIFRIWLCDDKNDCLGGEDERNCEENTCDSDYRRCDNGQCIPKAWWCDQSNDCKDGSDEHNCTINLNCKQNEYRCENGYCIDQEMVCDGVGDCAEGSDEANCSNAKVICDENHFECDDGNCIPLLYLCDQYNDCKNGEDENNCSTSEFKLCASFEYPCQSGKCIPEKWTCDGEDDCGDNSDETLFQCNATTYTPMTVFTCAEDMFRCDYNKCIQPNQLCNGHFDCMDHSDEGSECFVHCGKNNGGCAHICTSSPSGPKCSCYNGFTLGKDGFSCEDTDECSEFGHCSHYCNNTKGSFICSCATGYSLTYDHRSCKAKGGTPILLYRMEEEIKSLYLLQHADHILLRGKLVSGLDYITSEKENYFVIWADPNEQTINSYSVEKRSNSIILKDLQKPVLLAFDWIALNYYYTTSEAILACNNGTTSPYCATLLRTNHTSALVLIPQEGLMFWTSGTMQTMASGLIARSEMDGSEYHIIVSDKVYSPTAIAADHILKRIYWSEYKLNLIESVDFEGHNRQIVVQDGIHHPFGLTVFEDFIIWSDWGTDNIYKCNKFKCDSKQVVLHGHSKAKEMAIVHPVLRKTVSNPCLNKTCDQLCLLKRNSSVCRCVTGYVLHNSRCEKITDTKPSKRKTCSRDYCYNNGQCTLVGSTKICICESGYGGKKCEKVGFLKSNSGLIAAAVFVIVLVLFLGGFIFVKGRSKKPRKHFKVFYRKFTVSSEQDEESLVPNENVDITESCAENDLYNRREFQYVDVN